ncbi:NADH-quinone oxidoreductase subunit N [Melioribacter sp. OK-6-Me]|uniref:NADH-quinone oxidoreductase subunit N n=1 Tax=unclassified Melioribacter TaxID=2627329 RepID=UPI003EDAD586
MPTSNQEYLMMLPFVLLGATILISIIIEISLKRSEEFLPWFSAVAFLATGIISLWNINDQTMLFGGMIGIGGKSAIFNFIFNIAAMLVVLASADYLKKYGTYYGEYYILIQSSVLGMMLMASTQDLIMIFMGLELMSICFYILAGINRKKLTANEAALKYFLLGAFASGFILYGLALVYGSTQTTSIYSIVDKIFSLQGNILFWTGVLLLVVGFSFKIAAVPFHMWVPDVYQGAATTVTGLMSTAGKTAAFAVLIIFLALSFPVNGNNVLQPYFAIIATLSMIAGSIIALSQSNLKRLLAYSSIAHAGYMSIGLAANNVESISGIIFYLAAYTFMNIGAFAVISVLEGELDTNLDLDSYAGLNSRSPFLAAVMSLFMFALAGIPPLAGFFGKYYVFLGAIEGGLTWLAIVGALSSVISVYFYLKVVVYIYFKEPQKELSLNVSPYSLSAIVISALFVLLFGIFPDLLLRIISIAVG